MEMGVKAVHRYARTSPKKAKLVLDLVRGKGVEEAFAVLSLLRKRNAVLVSKLLKSAVANAMEKGLTDTESLYVKEAYACKGPSYKRFRPRAMGRAYQRRRPTSHITVVVEEREV